MADEALTLLLVDVGRNKIGVIKVVREVTGIDLAGAKAAVEAASPARPLAVVHGLSCQRADELAASFAKAGAQVAFTADAT
ncbi:MAG: ribosomal protein L7/L12 [Acidimicrobiales bacterium]